jgi:hypothetical protein
MLAYIFIYTLSLFAKAYLSTLHFHFWDYVLSLPTIIYPAEKIYSPCPGGSSAPKLITFDLPDTVFYTDLFYIAAKGNHR